ncbi:flagellar FliJ protein [Homoserinimonas aerilata]|uniref:Flagellar FliJ protein n=1 Tax=Homoserinimonas aerilata TaxID=1162970 RepID=A0A542YEU9_9MICO|nr:flagellar export protein FliJ [Homoserinimonas aerilata]TQL46615.1 flagellar FliJ protein [Homoserinimonas aerilata]
MSRQFSLAGLLRLRHLQQDLAAGELAAARGRLDVTTVRQDRARAALGATTTDVTSTESLSALAAGRASMRSSLSDLDALGRGYRQEAELAEEVFGTARRESIGLEKLEKKHAERLAAEDLVAEQNTLDELASTTWFRDTTTERPES